MLVHEMMWISLPAVVQRLLSKSPHSISFKWDPKRLLLSQVFFNQKKKTFFLGETKVLNFFMTTAWAIWKRIISIQKCCRSFFIIPAFGVCRSLSILQCTTSDFVLVVLVKWALLRLQYFSYLNVFVGGDLGSTSTCVVFFAVMNFQP